MSRSVDRALEILRERMRTRNVEWVADRIADHHGVTLLDVASWAPIADLARRDIAKALTIRGVSMVKLAEWLGADLEEIGELMVGDHDQPYRIAAALGWS